MMIIKSLITTILLSFYFISVGSLFPALAVYDPFSLPNNKIGVHILHPSEVGEAAKLVNSNGGEWGYVTVPIQPSDRDQTKWQDFMRQCKENKVIPIIRITTIPLGGTWEEGTDTDLVDFANFLSELDWPIDNRYIVLFNEVNRDTEWGGKVDPESYTRIAKNAFIIFKERSEKFFLLGPALDSALPNSSTSLSASSYMRQMMQADSDVWTYFDGWASHSYPNPGFSASPNKTGWTSIVSYRQELAAAKIVGKPVFITETGWDQNKVPPQTLSNNWRIAFDIWNKDPKVVAVTPFVFHGGSQFQEFSLMLDGNVPSVSGQAILDLPKLPGTPQMAQQEESGQAQDTSHLSLGSTGVYRPSALAIQIENFFRQLFGLNPYAYIGLGGKTVKAEVVTTPKGWEQGLSGREGLGNYSGMLFDFPTFHNPVFWMKNMKFPIDIIWLSDSTIVDITKNVPVPDNPTNLPTYSPKVKVNRVLELPANWVDSHGVSIQDQITITK